MGLVDLTTDLKSLKFGKDRVGGGSSKQPYIQSDIPDSLSDLSKTGGVDFLLRGGSLVPNRAVKDVSRLTKMFFDTKSMNGIFFTGKQLLLSRTNVKTQASPIAFNNGIYLPTSTIAQAGVNALGVHLNKQGIDPTGLIAKKGILTQPRYIEFQSDIKDIATNRLLELKNQKLDTIGNEDTIIAKYDGGPGSILGIGRTKLIRATNTRDGVDSSLTNSLYNKNYFALNYEQLSNEDSSKFNPQIKEDFRVTANNPVKSNIYLTKNIEQRVHLGNPARKKSKSSYSDTAAIGPTDKVNSFPLYETDQGIGHSVNDLVKFRIGVINNNNPRKREYMHFRAFIDSYDDSYSADWSSNQYVGRADKVYRYGGFDRSINMAWTVAAQSKEELIPMYQKLNFLASVCAPDYSDFGFMRGNLISLTVGGWLHEQVGFMDGITYSVPQESPWEIAIDENGNSDPSVKEMPMIIQVTGFKFTPIHSFLPQKQKNTYEGGNTYKYIDGDQKQLNAGQFISKFGPERYIELSKGKSGNKPLDNYGDPEDGSIVEGNRNYVGKLFNAFNNNGE